VLSVRPGTPVDNSSLVQFNVVIALAGDRPIVRARKAHRHTWAWACAVLAALLALAAGLLGYGGRLDPAAEGSPFSWAGAAAVVLAAVAAGGAALRWPQARARRGVLALGLLCVAADDALGLHERFADDLDPRSAMGGGGLGWGAVGLVGYAILLAAVVVLLAAELRGERRARPMLTAGVTLLVLALLARVAGGALAAAGGLPHGHVRNAGESADHAAKLAGWVLVVAALGRIAFRPARKRRPPPDQSEAAAAAQ
jgi:hypothetical protein